MKRAVSISLGSSKRDKRVQLELLGEPVVIERIGTDGDMERAAQLYRELDGQVDAFGVGGADLGLLVDDKWYPLHSVKPMVRFIHKTPVVDGTGLKSTLEHGAAAFLEQAAGAQVQPKRALFTAGSDRWGMSVGFLEQGYDCVFGDLMFALDVPIPLRSAQAVKRMAAVLMPLVSRLPFSMIYPTGDKQEAFVPKHERWYKWATVLAGDCHFIKRHMPLQLPGRTVVTNTTTAADVQLFRERGIRYLVTTTPVLEGRSFGTNMMEAALVAVAGKGRKLTTPELVDMIARLGFKPQLQQLN
ncbi:MAG: quinate 5-dehydrogenase [Chloroflexi bacterium]|nr:quinate 5-dehydrogenase [Chloroflexota bacterium]